MHVTQCSHVRIFSVCLSVNQWVSTNLSPLSSSPGLFSSDSYSAAGSEGSISTSVASLPPQASGSSAPSSPGSRRSVSTLKKWLTNPVRKLSAGATAKGERQVRKLEGKPPPLPSHSHSQEQLGSSPRPDEALTILPVTHRELVSSGDKQIYTEMSILKDDNHVCSQIEYQSIRKTPYSTLNMQI